MKSQMTKAEAEGVLGLPDTYTKADLRRCYAAIAQEYHPDVAERNGHTQDEAQRMMADANIAFTYLQDFFDGAGEQRIRRGDWGGPVGGSGIESGFGDADWRSGVGGDAHANHWGRHYSYAPGAEDDGFWDFAENEEDDPADERVPVTVRTVLLGPVVPRVAFVGLFAWVWWRTFALLPHNAESYPFPGSDVAAWARLMGAVIYPTYLLAYEAITGYVSGLVRELLNGLVSLACGRYVDLRPKTASYGCSLYKLLKNQIWALLMLPVLLWLAGHAAAPGPWTPERIGWAVCAAAFGVDTLAACVRGGLINTWTSALAEWVEARYLMARRRILVRCGQWRGR